MDTGDVRAPRWMEQKRGGEANPAAPPRWKKGRPINSEEGEQPTPQAPSGAGAPNSEGSAPATGASPLAAAPTPNQDEEATAARRAQIAAQAKADGVDIPDGTLQKLDASALEQWAKEHLL